MSKIDFKLVNKIKLKKDLSFPEYHDDHWVIENKKGKSRPIKIQKISSESLFEKNKAFIVDFRFFIQKYYSYLSFNTLLDYCDNFKIFLSYLNEHEDNVLSFADISYNTLLGFGNFLQDKKGNVKKYNVILSILKKSIHLEDIKLHQDIQELRIPKIKLSNNKETIKYYSEEDFESVVTIILYFINDYFNNNHSDTNTFVKFSYWLIACCTGFNKTALNSLSIDSFEFLDNGSLLIVGEKNRSSKGYQHITLNINENGKLLIKVIEELKKIREENKQYLSEFEKNTIFPLYNQNFQKNKKNSFKYISYNGNLNFLSKRSPIYKKIINNNSLNYVLFSTLKIRNNWANKIFDLSQSEKITSKIMNHKSEKTTLNNYLNRRVSQEVQKKFLIFQELLYSFAKNTEFNKWSEFQKAFNVSDNDLDQIVFDLKNGVFETIIGNCLKDNSSNCKNYLQCFDCENFSIIGEKDLWKIISFKELLKSEQGDRFIDVIQSIDDIISDFDDHLLLKVKEQYHSFGRHPFFKNKNIINVLIKE